MLLSTATTEYVKVPVSASISGSAVDPTSDTVQMCLLAEGATPSDEWEDATWETAGTTYLARLLVSTPTAGRYVAWVKVAHGSETIVRPAPGIVLVV